MDRPVSGKTVRLTKYTRRGFVTRTLALGAATAALPSLWQDRAVAQQRRGGTLVVAVDTDPPTINPAITTGATDQIVGAAMYNSLIWIDTKYEPHPYLAESYTVAPNGLTYTFNLRRSVKWHDGHPFTADDVKFSLEEILAKYHPISKNVLTTFMTGVETPDPYTVTVRLSKPYGPFLNIMTNFTGTILPKHIYQGSDPINHPANMHPVGTGPFRLSSWNRGDRLTLERNGQYFMPGQPYLDRVVFKIIPDVNARTVALQAGEVDYVWDYFWSKDQYPKLSKDPNLQFNRNADFPNLDILIFNDRKKPLADADVRKAIAHAFDRQLLVQRVWYGLGQPGHSAIPTSFGWAYNKDVDYQKMYAFNPAMANSLLDKAGYAKGPSGSRFTLRLIYDSRRPDWVSAAELIKEQLGNVGITVQLEGSERAVVIDRVFIKSDFDMTLQTYATQGDPAIGIERAYICSAVRPAPFVNASGYCNPAADALFTEGAGASTHQQRAVPYAKLQTLLANDVPTLVIREAPSVDVARKEVHGLWQHAQGWAMLGPVWTTR
jgi:peptide/nickel transport system substrate-binding protein